MQVDSNPVGPPQRANSDSVTVTHDSEEMEANTSLPEQVSRNIGLPTISKEQELMKELAQGREFHDIDWPALKAGMKARITEHIETFSTSEACLYDKELKPPWILTVEQVAAMKARLFDKLDDFTAEPPFTIQRLSELALSPIPHYASSLPKYLRALMRCLLVTSPYSVYDPPAGSILMNGFNASSAIPGTTNYRSRSSSVSSTSSNHSHHSMPLLSPIPFLVNRREATPDGAESSAAQPLPAANIAEPLEPSVNGSDLPHGRVDELDAGADAREAGVADKDPAALMDQPVELSLASRFVSASETSDMTEQAS